MDDLNDLYGSVGITMFSKTTLSITEPVRYFILLILKYILSNAYNIELFFFITCKRVTELREA